MKHLFVGVMERPSYMGPNHPVITGQDSLICYVGYMIYFTS